MAYLFPRNSRCNSSESFHRPIRKLVNHFVMKKQNGLLTPSLRLVSTRLWTLPVMTGHLRIKIKSSKPPTPLSCTVEGNIIIMKYSICRAARFEASRSNLTVASAGSHLLVRLFLVSAVADTSHRISWINYCSFNKRRTKSRTAGRLSVW